MVSVMLKKYTRAEIKEHNSTGSCWMVIDNRVYDVTKFLDEHPGGCEVLLEQAGRDATEAFEDVGHSTDARDMKESYLIGEINEDEKSTYSYDAKRTQLLPSKEKELSSFFMEYGYPVVFFVFLAILIYWFSRAIFEY